MWADNATQNTLKYITTYLANLPNWPKYLGYLNKSSHWASKLCALTLFESILYANHITKGQIITTMTNFRENSRTPKSPFEIIWPLLIRPPPTRFSDLPTDLVFSVLLMQRWMMIHTRLGLGWALHFFSGLDFGTSQTKQLYLFRYLPHKLSHCIIIIKNR